MKLKVMAFSILATILAACSEPQIAVHGDSTAIGSRDGLAKIWNLAPSWDDKRWWTILGNSYDPNREVFNDGVGGQSIVTLRDKMVSDLAHRSLPTIIYDRRNTGETADAYMTNLTAAIATLETDRFLIMPQVPQSAGKPESVEQIGAMVEIDAAVLAKWPNNTFSPEERALFFAALQPDDTRADGLHRNEKGQAIEAEFIGRWLHERNW